MPSDQSQAIFVARGLTKVYRMGEVEVQALRGIDLTLHRGELVVLLGPSGSGKSTLLNILGGLDVPTGGTVHFLDHDLRNDDDEALTRFRREHVGFVYQFYNLIPSLTARENVELALINERMASYAECGWNEEKDEPGFQCKRLFGDAVAAVMGAKDNKWITQHMIEIEVPMMLSNLKKGKAQMVDGEDESEVSEREMRRANRGED